MTSSTSIRGFVATPEFHEVSNDGSANDISLRHLHGYTG